MKYDKLLERNKINSELTLNKFKEAEILYLTNNYSLTKLSIIFKFSRQLFSKYLKKQGYVIENNQNKCLLNEHVFDSIDSEEKAYWLGFMFADGYVSKDNNRIELSLKLSDYSHLKKFKNFLQWKNNIKTDSFRCRIYFANSRIKKMLIHYGCVPQKSLKLNFIKNSYIEKNLLRHFIRGYFDGDGCICIQKIKIYSCIEFIGTEFFLKELLNNTDWKKNKLQQDKRHSPVIKKLRYSGKTVLSILHYLYKDSNIYLDRKYSKYKELCRIYEES